MNDQPLRFSGSDERDLPVEPEIERDDHRRRRAHEPASPAMTLNMTPMIDVVFLLLIYFVLGSSFRVREESIVLQIPEHLEGAAAQMTDPFELPSSPIEVRIVSRSDDRGDYTLALGDPSIGAPATLDELRDLLRGSQRDGSLPPDQEFAIRPQGGVRWEHAIEVLRAIRLSGFERVRLVNPAAAGG